MKKEFDNSLNLQDVLLDTLPNPVYYKDPEGRFIRCNTAFAKLVNKPKEYIIGKVAYEFFPKTAADRHRHIDKKIMKTLGTNEDEVFFPMYTGELKIFILNKAVYLNEDGQVGGIVCVMDDLTQNIKQRNLLIQQSKFAEMGEMVASIAHQWNEPLVEISAQIQKMELFYSIDKMNKEEMKLFVSRIMTQIKYMSETLYDFRNFLKPSKNKEFFNIKQAIDDIFEIVGKEIFYFNINIKIEYEEKEEALYFYGFKNELKQVILNIVNNAKNKIVNLNKTSDLKGTISINIRNDEEYSIIEIKDNAGRIAENIIENIFEPFFTTSVNGMGFGLYMCKLIIEGKMSGNISVRNENENVIFTIKIPLNKSQKK